MLSQRDSRFLLVVSLAFLLTWCHAEATGESYPEQNHIAQVETEPEVVADQTSSDIAWAKLKRGINLGRKMMCQIDHRNCRSFNEAKRFNTQPRIGYNRLLLDIIKNSDLAPLLSEN